MKSQQKDILGEKSVIVTFKKTPNSTLKFNKVERKKQENW